MSTDDLIAHVEQLRSTPVAEWSTRDRILREAARLIATKGYHGASTRDIASAVGIRQPSLFNHFDSKVAIVVELMRYDTSVATARIVNIARDDAPASDRLLRYLLWDFTWYARMPFDLRGLKEELHEEPGLEQFAREHATWTASLTSIIRDGVASGEFHDVDPSVVVAVVISICWEMIRSATDDRPVSAKRRRDAADFVLRGLSRS